MSPSGRTRHLPSNIASAVDMSPAAIRARLRKVDELRRLAKYLSSFKPVTSNPSVETKADPTQQ